MTLALEIGGVVRTVQVRPRNGHLSVLLDGQEQLVDAVELEPGRWSLLVGSRGASIEARVRAGRAGAWTVFLNGTSLPVAVEDPDRARSRASVPRAAPIAAGPGETARITAPMPGKVVRVLVRAGEAVTARQPLVVVEAMKMENELRAPRDGTVLDVFAREGASVDAGAPLLTIA